MIDVLGKSRRHRLVLTVFLLLLCRPFADFINIRQVAFASENLKQSPSPKDDFSGIEKAIAADDFAWLVREWDKVPSALHYGTSVVWNKRMLRTIEFLLTNDQDVALFNLGELNIKFIEFSRTYQQNMDLQKRVILQLQKGSVSLERYIIEISEKNNEPKRDMGYFLAANIYYRRAALLRRYLVENNSSDFSPSLIRSDDYDAAKLLRLMKNFQSNKYSVSFMGHSGKKYETVDFSWIRKKTAELEFYLGQYDNSFRTIEDFYRDPVIAKPDESDEPHVRFYLSLATNLIRAFVRMGDLHNAERAAHMIVKFGWIQDRILKQAYFSSHEVIPDVSSENKMSLTDVYQKLALRNATSIVKSGELLQAFCRLHAAGFTSTNDIYENLRRELERGSVKSTPAAACDKTATDKNLSRDEKKSTNHSYFAFDDSMLWKKKSEELWEAKRTSEPLREQPVEEKTEVNSRVEKSVLKNSSANDTRSRIPFDFKNLPCLWEPAEPRTFLDMTFYSFELYGSSLYCLGGVLTTVGTIKLISLAEEESRAAVQFIAFNRESLAKESAMQSGLFLDAFSDIIRIRPERRKKVNQLLAANHAVVFSDENPQLIFNRIGTCQ